MKSFIKRLFIFLLPFLLFSYGLDIFLSKTLKKSGSYADGEFPIWNTLYAGKINSDIVIYGSSRALKHIDPAMIRDSLHKSSYNLGVNGHSFRSEYFRHYLLLKYNKKPELIIQTLDVTSFEKKSDLYNPDQYLPYMLFNTDMRLHTYNGYPTADYYIPMIRYYGKKEALLEILDLIVNPSGNKPLRTRGYHSNDFTWNNDLQKAQEELGSFKVVSDTTMIELFDRYLAECARENIEVVFVYTPEYIEGQNFVSNRKEIMDLYDHFSAKYGITYFNYSRDTMSYKKEYFYNSGHLNSRGSELFTAKLINDLRKAGITDNL